MKEVGSVGAATQYQAGFPSAMTSEYPVNDTVPLQIYVPKAAKAPVPVVLVLHYWGATDLKVERAMCLRLAECGIGSAIMTLPYHLSRTPAGYRSGALAIQADPEHLVATMTQSLMDVRRSVDFLQSRAEFDKSKIGIAGTSLGAIVAALAYGVEPRFQCAAFLLGGIDLAHIIWNSSRVVSERDTLRANGYTEGLLREQLKSIEPGDYLPSRSSGATLVIGARFDTVIPRASTEALIKDLPGVKSTWMDTGHYGGVFVQRRLLGLVGNFFTGAFGGRANAVPATLAAPTVRLGADAAVNNGFDIAVGFDLIRPKGTRSPFASFLISPRGPRLFLGQGVDRGVALGFTLMTKQSGVGLLWSTVL